MKRLVIWGVSALLAAGLAAGVLLWASPPASAGAEMKKYRNCSELNKVYKGGVARSASTKNVGGKTKYKPFVSAKLYEMNSGKDRDKDGIACEK
ncbi:excalibur calcium-binding domain-containing protein [Paenibacillus sp. HN-1]|uniref:excalibur calcium-binding domain-containing protein n=1 Tax=Paenibacillus TaxID=44249 RepID=UPI001CA7EEA5|nr:MULTISPECIES: excalibur calcium-binding domain-containing protein [Paenibacillus]MBY9079692.1 excalibur calcium-binding domain-containing protein [Paenibacillus sp. CGMCC 1.18879]MBY9082943.1 excalibur calcium-binding domain-containing protein [Paenibacillus sinensis]